VSGVFRPSDEVDQIRYFDTDRLPEFFPEQRRSIRRVLEFAKKAGADTDDELA
jgi:hypothetical protein